MNRMRRNTKVNKCLQMLNRIVDARAARTLVYEYLCVNEQNEKNESNEKTKKYWKISLGCNEQTVDSQPSNGNVHHHPLWWCAQRTRLLSNKPIEWM